MTSLVYLLGCFQLWGECNMGHHFEGGNPKQSTQTSHLSIYIQVYFCGQKKHCVCALHSAADSLGYPSYLIGKGFDPKWSLTWGFIRYICSLWRLPFPCQWLNWTFWSYSRVVSPFECFLLISPGYSWILSLVCPSMDCVHYSDIFDVMYCKMEISHILDLFLPSLVCTGQHHMRLWVWVGVIFYFHLIYVLGLAGWYEYSPSEMRFSWVDCYFWPPP